MTLPYRQERLLRQMDRDLCRSDPDLASMLSIFGRLTAAEGMPARERLRPEPTWAWRVLLWPVAAVAFLVVFAPGGGLRAARACSAASVRRVHELWKALVTPKVAAGLRIGGRVNSRNGPF